MPSRFVRTRRRLRRIVPALLVFIAIGAYGALLLGAHGATNNERLRQGDEQLFGSDGIGRKNILFDRPSGAIELGRSHPRSASAQWRLGPTEPPFDPATTIRSEEIFITGLAFSLYAPSSFATVYVDGKPLQTFRPPAGSLSGRGPFAVGNVALEPIDLAPQFEMGFRLSIPPDGACVRRQCTVAISVANSTWVVHRVGLIFSTTTPEPVLWPRPLPTWAILCIGAALAIASHLALSTRPRRRPSRTATEWKTT
jgi:hypothetical protein